MAPFNRPFPETGWEINNGVLTVLGGGNTSKSAGKDIVTEKTYGAFQLQFDFKITDTANSGVKYFVFEDPKKKNVALGLEYQILDDDKHPDAKAGMDGNRTMASLYDMIAAKKIPAAKKKVGEWNHAMIVVRPDNYVEHWLNGFKVVEYVRKSKEFNDLVSKSKYNVYPGFGLADKGYIMLTEHGSTVSFTNLKIKEL